MRVSALAVTTRRLRMWAVMRLPLLAFPIAMPIPISIAMPTLLNDHGRRRAWRAKIDGDVGGLRRACHANTQADQYEERFRMFHLCVDNAG